MATEPFSISSRIVSRIVDAARDRRVDVDALCREVGIDPADVRDVDAHIEIGPYLRLWGAVMARVVDQAFPLSIAESWSKSHNLLRFVCMSSRDVGESLERAGRYLRIITNAVSWPLERGPSISILAMERQTPSGGLETRYADEFGCAEVVTLVRAFTGKDWNPVEVRFAFTEPPDLRAHHAFFRAPLKFGQPRTEIHLATSSLALPMLRADPATAMFFESYMEKLLRTDEARTTADEVREVLAKTLRGTVPTLEDVALELDISGRTLRRRLKLEETSFQRLLDETRFAFAKRHIEAGQLPLSTIAFLLGFSEPSAFHRAFRRWSGKTPQAYARSMTVRA